MVGQVTVEHEEGRITIFDGGTKVAEIQGTPTQCVDLADYLRKRI